MMSSNLHAHTPVLAVLDPRGLAVRAVAYHRTEARATAQARITHTTYDASGRAVAQRDPRLFALSRTGATAPPNVATRHSLSGRPLCRTSVDAGARVQLFGEGGEVLRYWDGTDGQGPQHRTDYDALRRPIAVYERMGEGPERCEERFVYAGSSIEEVARNRCGRLVECDDPAGTLAWPDYGLLGAPLREVRQFFAAPDLQGSPDVELEPERFATTWRYDALGAVHTQTDAQGNLQGFAVDVAGQLHEATLVLTGIPLAQRLLHSTAYDAAGRLIAQTAGNGVTRIFDYDPASGRLQSSTVQRPGVSTSLSDSHYTYDPVGNLVCLNDKAQPVRYFKNRRIDGVSTYAYDSLYQLIEATGRESATAKIGPWLPDLTPLPNHGAALTPYRQTYAYDPAGNLTELHHLGEHPTHRTFAVHEHRNWSLPWKEGDPQPEWTAAFDAHGNLRRLSPGGQALRWNARHQLQQVTQLARTSGGENDSESYAYDAGGQRVRKFTHSLGQTVVHVRQVRYLTGLELHSDSGGEEWAVIVATGARALRWSAGRPAEIPDNQIRYSVSDHLGSSTWELDAEAALLTAEGYYPYGGTAWRAGRRESEADYKTVRYSGKERDATGLYYYGFRYYAPWLQRWLNPDPAGDIDGLNRYRFVGNNPVTLTDKQGLSLGDSELKAGKTLLRFFKSLPRPEASFHKMTSKGTAWQKWGIRTSADLSQVMRRNQEGMTAFLATLDERESAFLEAFRGATLYAVHRTDSEFPKGFQLLSYATGRHMGKTSPDDVAKVATHDFVFFTVQASTEKDAQVSDTSNNGARYQWGFDIARHPKLKTGLVSLFDPLGGQPGLRDTRKFKESPLGELFGAHLPHSPGRAERQRARNRAYDNASEEVRDYLYRPDEDLSMSDLLGGAILQLARQFHESDRDMILGVREPENFTRLINTILAPELMVPHHFLPGRNAAGDIHHDTW